MAFDVPIFSEGFGADIQKNEKAAVPLCGHTLPPALAALLAIKNQEASTVLLFFGSLWKTA